MHITWICSKHNLADIHVTRKNGLTCKRLQSIKCCGLQIFQLLIVFYEYEHLQ